MEVHNPRITRTLSRPAEASFHDFHKALIISFGWALTHQYRFNVLDEPNVNNLFGPKPIVEFGDFEPEWEANWKNSSKIKLFKYIENPAYSGKFLQYNYDFGDNWNHSITYLGKGPRTEKFRCIDGEGHGPAEDAGGLTGWGELKEAYRTGNPNAKQKEFRQWYEEGATNGFATGLGGERIWRWSQDKVNRELARLPEMIWEHDRNADA